MSRPLSALLALGLAALSACHDDGDDRVTLVGPQLGTVTIELASGAVGFTAQPQGLKLQGSAVYDDAADTLTLALTVKNNSKTTLSNLKALVTSLSEGALTGDGDFDDGGGGTVPFVYFGPESLRPGAAVTRDLVVTGVLGAAAELELDLDLRHHGWLFAPTFRDEVTAADSAGTGEELLLDASTLGFFGDETQLRPMAASPNGRYVYFACRNQPAVARLDLSTLTVEFTKSLMGGNIGFDGTGVPGSIDSLTLTPDGKNLYAVVNEGAHSFRHSGTYFQPRVRLVRLNASTLAIGASMDVFPPGLGGSSTADYRGRRLSISADGKRGALALTGRGLVFLIDLQAMELIDVDPLNPGAQGFLLSSLSDEPRFAAISPDGARIYVAFASFALPDDGTLQVIDVATAVGTPLAPPTVAAGGINHPTALEFGPDGRLYYARNQDPTVPGLSVYDPATDTWVEPALADGCAGLWFEDDVYYVYDTLGVVRAFDAASDVELNAPGSGLPGVPVTFAAPTGHGLVFSGD